jgi:ribonucleoside-diphosphate reductase alpha chain
MEVTKRNGQKEELSVDKINNIVAWACEGLDANPSDIIMNAKIKFTDDIKTTKIHELLVDSATDLISARYSDYQFVASKLFNFYLRKQIFGKFLDEDMPHIFDVLTINTELGLYDKDLIGKYSKEEWDQINDLISHNEDSKLSIASYKKMYSSYLARNRHSGYVYETPQYCFMLIAATLFDNIKDVGEYYNLLRGKWLNQPTPIMAGVRTPTRQFASCTLIDIDDDLDSIYASAHAVGRFVSRKAGIGLNMGKIRSLGSPIRGGEAVHTGIIPFLKLEEAAVKSCSQGGIREGSATVHFQIWNAEIESILVLKNNKGTDDNRVRRLDYSIQLSKLFLQRMIKSQDITLLSTSECPGLYDAWGLPEFDDLYLKYEKEHIKKYGKDSNKIVKGRELLQSLVSERINTGRIYIQMIDNVNNNNAFNDKIVMSNLCQEILLPVKPIKHVNDEEGEIALCMLGGVNLGKLSGPDTFSRLEKPCKYLVRGLDKIMDIQDYPVKASEKQKGRRSIGIGVTNFAYFLAKNGLKYDDKEALPLVDELFEHLQFYLIKASMELAMENGPCELFHETKYAKGIMPIDRYNKKVDELVDRELTLDWEWLRGMVLEHGMANSVLTAIMPSESSSVVTNATNGIEPPRALVTTKVNKGTSIKIVVPSIKSLGSKYTLAWDITDNRCINELTCVMQKWIDQAISVNHYYNPLMYEGNKTPAKVVIKDIVDFYKYGGKNLYYANTLDTLQEDETSGCEGGGCTL